MNIFKRNVGAADRIRKSDRAIQKLRNKRSKLNEIEDNKKIKKINDKIHKNKLEIDIAYVELKHPRAEVSNRTSNISFNNNINKNGKQFHFHINKARQ